MGRTKSVNLEQQGGDRTLSQFQRYSRDVTSVFLSLSSLSLSHTHTHTHTHKPSERHAQYTKFEIKKEISVTLLQVKSTASKKSADHKTKLSEAFVPLTGVMCALDSADLVR